jgi:glycerophosphoryl diester phosphodiesterase
MLKIGHRGASAYAPENTLIAFQKALEMGADGIELDVRVCKSGELVVFHDYAMDRLKPEAYFVRDLTLHEMRSFPRPGGERIPTLPEVLEALGPEVWYFVDIKHADGALPAADVMQQYARKGWRNERLCFLSEDHLGIAPVLEAFPSLTVAAPFVKLTDSSVQEAKALGARFIVPDYLTFEKKHVEQAHALGIKIVAWTAYKDEPEHINALRSLGVDGIMSNYPDRL